MGFRSLGFVKGLWLLPLAALAASPALAAPLGKPASGQYAGTAVAAPAPQPEPRPALWLLADEDTKIYLFGTIHVLPPGFRWRSAALDKAVGEAAELVVETYEPPGTEGESDVLAGFFADDAPPILDRVPEDRRAPLAAAIEASGLPIDYFDRMHSWAAAMTLGIAQMLGDYGVQDPGEAPGVEDVLEAAFRDAGKPIFGVEDGDAVLASLGALPEPVQRRLLIDAIAPPPETARADEAAVGREERLWAAGHDEAMDLEQEESFPPEMFDVLVRRRNAAWTEWLAERLKQPGTLLFAVGAGHLAGRESVQAMLARRGLRVKRIG